jgi:hypothetical protein
VFDFKGNVLERPKFLHRFPVSGFRFPIQQPLEFAGQHVAQRHVAVASAALVADEVFFAQPLHFDGNVAHKSET